MPQEIEIKLEAPLRPAGALTQRPWLLRLSTAPVRRERLVSVYYDTNSSALRKADISLRVRRGGGKTVQTVKQGGVGPLGRQEWEWEIDGPEPDFDRKCALPDLDIKKLRRELGPVFETDVRRAILPVRYRGSEIEIAVDRGQVKTGRRHQAISEIELELKKGAPTGLVRLAERIAREAGAHYGVLAKAARGYALRAGETHAPISAPPIRLDPDMTAGDCFKVIALSCLHHFAANEKAVAADEPEGVHQMRVGLRRLRTAIALFQTLLRGRETQKVKAELKWLTEELGPARDLDVLVREDMKKLEEAQPEQDTLPALGKELRARRRQGFARAKTAIATLRYRKLVLDTALWIAGGGWARGKDALIVARRRQSGRDFAAAQMARRLSKILKQQKKLEKLDAMARHKLRIKIKKLRYAGDFFAALFGADKARGKFEKALKTLQTALGKLNDMRIHGKIARDFAHPRGRKSRQPQKAFAMGLLSGREQAAKAALVAQALKGGKKLSRLSPFWD